MDRLRSPGGCPWDAEQTHTSLVGYAVEETYELVEAIETGTAADIREELGDVLLQVVFHSRIAEEGDPGFSLAEVAHDICDKLIRRHPHVFDATPPDSGAHLDHEWQRRKAIEKGRRSALDGIPSALPALTFITKVRSRTQAAGLDLTAPAGPTADTARRSVDGLLREVPAHDVRDPDLWANILGELIDRAEHLGVDLDAALRAHARTLADRVRDQERSVT